MTALGPRLAALGAIAASVLATPDARAQEGGGLIELQLELPDSDENDDDVSAYAEVTNAVEIRRYFNLARCQCGQNFGLEMQVLDPSRAPQRPVELFVGSSCDDVELRDMLCEDLGSPFGDASNDLRNPQTVLIPIDKLADPNTNVCPDSELTARTYVMVDDDGDPSEFAYVDIFELFLDLNPPPLPRSDGECLDVEATGSENSIVVDWTLSETRIDDFEFFQVLCAEVTGPDTVAPAFDSPPDPPEFETARQICGGPLPEVTARCGGGGGVDLDAGLADAGPGDAGPGDDPGPVLPPGLADLDGAFVCGTATFGATDIRLTGLQNGVEYRVLWVGIDPSRNPTVVDLGTATPGPLVDFWEDYKNQGGGAQGGYCFVATAAYGDYDHPMVVILRDFRDNTLAHFGLGRWLIRTYYDLSPPIAAFIAENGWARIATRALLWPLVVTAGLWEYTGVFGKLALLFAFALLWRLLRRRRRRAPRPRPAPARWRAALAAAAAAAVLLVANAASAQTYFEELDEDVPAEPSPSDVKWNFELKFGPYVPDVDSEFDGTGPFERVFGDGPFLMSQIALDRFFLWPRGGQLGATLGVGFLTKKAAVFADDDGDGMADVDMEGNPIRVSGENTTFRLLPLSASAVYRLTLLDDLFGVPIVPYGRAGLSYYLWWVTRPDGSTARACEMPGDDPETCQTTVGRGGSLGFQGSVGLAVRAERLDPDAGVNLRNELGIEHAGLFVELTYAQVDGFGDDTKLSVGDLTWFAGINFEF